MNASAAESPARIFRSPPKEICGNSRAASQIAAAFRINFPMSLNIPLIVSQNKKEHKSPAAPAGAAETSQFKPSKIPDNHLCRAYFSILTSDGLTR